MSKLKTLFTMALLLSFTLILATSRPDPAFNRGVPSLVHEDVDEESCEGKRDTEECLMRRTLAAHVDYIYTQKHKPKN